MRPMIVLAPKQINNDRIAPGITTSAVCGVEVNSSCDYKTHFPGAAVTMTLLRSRMCKIPPQIEECTHMYTFKLTQLHKDDEKAERKEWLLPQPYAVGLYAFETRVKT